MVGFCLMPQDVVEEIFLRLSADSLVRFKRVSKAWLSLISSLIKDPLFVAKNLQNIGNKSSSSFVVRHIHEARHSSITPFVVEGDNEDIGSLSEDLTLPLFQHGHYSVYSWRVGCHCDGNICLLRIDSIETLDNILWGEVMLCNPALQEFVLVPGSKNVKEFRSRGVGFGYDSRANNYKVVRILDTPQVKAEVHILGTDFWRQIDIPQDVEPSYKLRYLLYLKHVCYWEVRKSVRPFRIKRKILCFNMCDEVFHLIPLPNSKGKYVASAVWNDSFALFFRCKERRNPRLACYEIWVMDDYCDIFEGIGGYCPWTKHLVIGPLAGFPIPTKFWKSDELLLMDDLRVFSYNLYSQKLNDIGVDGLIQGIPLRFFVKSLVSVRQKNKQVIQTKNLEKSN